MKKYASHVKEAIHIHIKRTGVHFWGGYIHESNK